MFAEEEAAHWIQQNVHAQNAHGLPQIPEGCSLEESLRQLEIGNGNNVSEEVSSFSRFVIRICTKAEVVEFV